MNLRRVTSLELTLLKEEKGDQLADSYSIWFSWFRASCRL